MQQASLFKLSCVVAVVMDCAAAEQVGKYNFANPPQTWSMDTSHFTQMVWKSTTQVGCAYKVDCQKGAFFVCNYVPPGNFDGQFAANVFPAK
jgi:hypothetical protein